MHHIQGSRDFLDEYLVCRRAAAGSGQPALRDGWNSEDIRVYERLPLTR